MKWVYLKLLLILVITYALYNIGVPLIIVAMLGIIMLGAALAKEYINEKIDSVLTKAFPFIKGWPKWTRILAVLICFALAYTLLKLIIFELLKTADIDIQQEIVESINKSIEK